MKGLCVVFYNLTPRKLVDDFESNGMVLFAGNEDHSQLELIRPHPDSKPGDRIFLTGGKLTEKPADRLSGSKYGKINKRCFP